MVADFHRAVLPDRPFVERAPLGVGEHVWIGARVSTLKGRRGAIVAAGAVVTRDVLPHSLVGGSPARVIRGKVGWVPCREHRSTINSRLWSEIRHLELPKVQRACATAAPGRSVIVNQRGSRSNP